MLKRSIFRWLSLILVGYSFLSLAAGIFVAEGALHPGRRGIPPQMEVTARHVAQGVESELQDVSMDAMDGSEQRAWFLRPRLSNENVVILLHGVGDNRLGMGTYAELLLKHRFNVLVPDMRAHGVSGGNLAAYGLLERQDIRGWFEWLQSRQHPHCIFGFGESMGAAVILQALQAEPDFCAVVAESSFANFREIAYDRMGQAFHAGPWVGRTVLWPVVEIGFLWARWKHDLDFSQVSPEQAVAETAVPVLLIHGQEDRNIPIRHAREIYRQNPKVALWEVPKTDHCGAISSAPVEFERRLVRWFEDNSKSVPNLASTLPYLH